MKQSDFFERLYNISGAYHWDVRNKKVVATIQSGPWLSLRKKLIA